MCTLEKRGAVYLLTLTGTDEHHLNPTLLASFRSALARARDDLAASGSRAAALVTAAEGKFFSNGFDIAWARASPSDRTRRMSSALQAAIADLLSLPMPTIAAVTGHAAAAGFILARCHDYVVMRADRGFVYMSELDIGVPMTRYFMEVIWGKVRDPRSVRDLVMGSEKMGAPVAERKGVIDQAVEGGAAETVEVALRMGEEMAAKGWDGGIYASIRRSTFPSICKEVGVAVDDEEEVARAFNSKL